MRSAAHFIAVLLALATPLVFPGQQAIIQKLAAFGQFLALGFDFSPILADSVGFGSWVLFAAFAFVLTAGGLALHVHQARSFGAVIAAVTPQLVMLCLAFATIGLAAVSDNRLTTEIIHQLGFASLGVNMAYALLVACCSALFYLLYLNFVSHLGR